MPMFTIKLPLFEPTHVKQAMYETMQSRFSLACNQTLGLKKEHPKWTKTDIDIEKGNLTLKKYVPVKTNVYSTFWVNYLLIGQMDKKSKYYQPSFEGIARPKKGSAQLFYKKGQWYFSFSLTFDIKQTGKEEKSIGVVRGLHLVAVAADPETHRTHSPCVFPSAPETAGSKKHEMTLKPNSPIKPF
jgi:hypothetical protein